MMQQGFTPAWRASRQTDRVWLILLIICLTLLSPGAGLELCHMLQDDP